MKPLSHLLLSALLAASVGVASASTITLASYGSKNSTPTGIGNTATVFNGGLNTDGTVLAGPSYNVGTGGVWAAPTGESSWVSNNLGNSPNGSNVEPDGLYDYFTTFTDATPGTSSGTIIVMADDTTSVYLNGTLITPAASTATLGTCASGDPTCTVPTTYDLTGFVDGTNILSFGVEQQHGSAEGLDFSGSINTSVTPEPNSLLLMGTGLIACAGLLSRRRIPVA